MPAYPDTVLERLGASLFWALDSDDAEDAIPRALAIVSDTKSHDLHLATMAILHGFLVAKTDAQKTPSFERQ